MSYFQMLKNVNNWEIKKKYTEALCTISATFMYI